MPDEALTNRAYLDDVTDGVARLLVGDDGHPRTLDAVLLPEGVEVGDWLVLDDDGVIVGTDPDMRARQERELGDRRRRLLSDRPSQRLRRRST